ncbi:unnamed protein product [Rotaria sp. Silwood2]|nr:unnamed protein product [Rotaria sp. Silwood2]CAF4304053.1 unnamed protein product [Rotaria sp. Silwood2]
MAQKNAKFIDKESNLNKQTKPFEFQSSISNRHCTSSESTYNDSDLSAAERYINMRLQMINNQKDHRLKIPSTESPIPTCVSHADIMDEWHNKQANEIHKNMPYRYQYGTPSCSSNNSTYRKIDSQINKYGVQKPNSAFNIDHKKKR